MIIRKGLIKENASTFASLYKLVDLSLIILCQFLCAFFYEVEFSNLYLMMAMFACLSFLFFSEVFSLYRSWRIGRMQHFVLATFWSWSASFVSMILLTFLLKESESFSRVVFTLWFLSAGFALLIWRFGFNLYLRYMRRQGHNLRTVAIIGANECGKSLLSEIVNNPEHGLQFVGFYDDCDAAGREIGHPTLGDVEEAVFAAKRSEIDIFYVALPLDDKDQINKILVKFGNTTADVHLVPDVLVFNLMYARSTQVGNIPTLSVFESPLIGSQALTKRIIDVVFSSVILFVVAVPMLLIAIAVKTTSRGPAIFKQLRYGLDGREIEVWKFRSMTTMDNGNVVKQATKGDARITPLGAFMRRTSIDELPQFFNVLKGDMSIVGPRPHAVAHNEEYREKISYYMLRHKVKPGITGWAQINGYRGETDTLGKMEKRVDYDLEYIRNWSAWTDVKIIFLTVFKGFVDKNAY